MNRLRRFMMGRYGVDELAYAFIVVLFILNIVSIFVPSLVFYLIFLSLLAFCIFRMLSKNIVARRRENYYFMKVWTPVRNFFNRKIAQFRNHKQYKYLVCKNCKKQMRVPRHKGTLMVTCPKCGNKIKTKT